MNSKKLIASYKAVNYWWSGFNRCVWRELSGLPDTDQREARREIEKLLYEVKEKIESVYGPRIGKQIMYEERIK